MRISHKHKFILISCPKTASTSVRDALNPFSDILSDLYPIECPVYGRYHNLFSEEFSDSHVCAVDLRKKFHEKNWNWNEYKILGFARNPWDREVSHFEYKKRFIEMYEKGETANAHYAEDCRLLLEKCDWDFKKFIKNEFMMESCYKWFCDNNGKLIITHPSKMESLQEDFSKFLKDVKLPIVLLDYFGISGRVKTRDDKTEKKKIDYKEYYDDETRQIVAKRYKKDIEYFNYEFGE